MGIKTADWKIVEAGENPVWERPVVVKPVDEGSSVGVTLARDETTYSSLFPSDRRLLVEDLIEGQEFTVAVVDDVHGTMALPVIEIRSKKSSSIMKASMIRHCATSSALRPSTTTSPSGLKT